MQFFFLFEESVGRVDDSTVYVDESVGRVDNSIGLVCGVVFFYPIVIESMSDIVPLFVLIPIGVESKGGRLIEIFWRPKP